MTEVIEEEARGWATIPDASRALNLNRQTLRNRAVAGKIEGAVRADDGQREWRIPGGYICDLWAEAHNTDPVDGVKISWTRQIRGSDETVTVTRTIWRTDELAARSNGAER